MLCMLDKATSYAHTDNKHITSHYIIPCCIDSVDEMPVAVSEHPLSVTVATTASASALTISPYSTDGGR